MENVISESIRVTRDKNDVLLNTPIELEVGDKDPNRCLSKN